ncbi:hypothetical protein [Frankia sp. CiP1_Cm_nod2]|uniref:hypothetical protein n=1 Tax=Frankia sp. CiP1_Cm_nod2 TaxID=2897161 RepID=UPI002024AC7B
MTPGLDPAALAAASEARVAAQITAARRHHAARRAAELEKRSARTAGLAARHARKISRLGGNPTMPVPTITPPAADPPTARTLIDTGACAAGCMLAVSPPRTCRCGCSGQHHGALGSIPVPAVDQTATAA